MAEITPTDVAHRYEPLDVLEAIARRHSVHAYLPAPVPEEILLTLVNAARWAASNRNLQPWEFVIVTDPRVKAELAPVVHPLNRNVVLTAGALFVCLASLLQQDRQADEMEQRWIVPGKTPEQLAEAHEALKLYREDAPFRRENVLTSTFIGITQMALAAQKFGLGTTWMGGFQEAGVKQVVGVPDTHIVASLLAVGWPAAEPDAKPRVRRPLEEIHWFNRYGNAK